ncbi:DUF3168 domain-containing protein [Primorskyibacter sp. S187A]|uniref:DUF3168 domain-containing protein n=1 Tax=Primorskyibacter sp. S187A TaxID=3415130 RepID=UPI003C7BD20E
MSYAVSAALQAAVFQTLATDATLNNVVGSAVYDALPAGQLPPIYVTLGAEQVRDASDKTGNGATHDIGLSVVTESAGFQQAKEAAAAISDALVDQPLTLSRGRLVSLQFLRAVAKRDQAGLQRRIDLTFRARVEDN